MKVYQQYKEYNHIIVSPAKLTTYKFPKPISKTQKNMNTIFRFSKFKSNDKFETNGIEHPRIEGKH